MTSEGLRHGEPESARNDKREFDKYRWPPGSHWPSGLEITIYDDGRVKVGGWHTSVTVLDVSSFRTGSTNASGHIIARFQPSPGNDVPAEAAGDNLDSLEQGEDSLSAPEPLSDDDDLSDEDAYERATWLAIEECKHLTPRYDPSIWIGMVRRSGAAPAAKNLLVSGDIQYGFRRLVDAGRPDLTIEWSVLHPRWRLLFSDQHREAARWRLRQAGVEPPED